MTLTTMHSNTSMLFFISHSFILGAPSTSDTPPQEAHLTTTAPREGGQSSYPALASRVHFSPGENLNSLQGKGRGLTVQDTAIADITPGHNLPGRTGETGTVCRTENLVQLQFNKLKPDSQIHIPAFVAALVCVLYFSTTSECTHT